MADGVWKQIKPKVIGPYDQLSLNKFFDSIILSMMTSKIQNGRQGVPKWPTGSEKGSTLQVVSECPEIQNGCQGAPIWPTGSGKGCTPRFLVPSTPSMRKVEDGESFILTEIQIKSGRR